MEAQFISHTEEGHINIRVTIRDPKMYKVHKQFSWNGQRKVVKECYTEIQRKENIHGISHQEVLIIRFTDPEIASR